MDPNDPKHGKRVLVLLAGRLSRWPAADGPFGRVICADGGVRHALAHGVRPDLIVGDFDSFAEEEIERYALLRGVMRRRYPAAKEATDGELAVDAALEMGAARVVIAGGLGGRVDHTVANLGLLARIDKAWGGSGEALEQQRKESEAVGPRTVKPGEGPPFPNAWVTDGEERVYLLRGDGRWTALPGNVGDRLSVLPVSDRLEGLSIRGVRWPLEHAAVRLGESLTVSNEFSSERATLSLLSGMAWIVTGPGDPE